jgi:NAD(P)-dependent dehydrogenase (short-subunit alcohol dehydrogenase family)
MAAYDTNMSINLRSAMMGMKYAARIMQKQRSGSIINTASLGGLRAGFSPLPYSAAKAALIHATRWVANELGPYNIRVNSISPGGIVTELFAKGSGMLPDQTDQALERLRPALKMRT